MPAVRVAFIVNPIAGIGGPAAMKGSDGDIEQAVARGYTPTAPDKARRFLRRLASQLGASDLRLYAAPGPLGAAWCTEVGLKHAVLGADLGLAADDVFTTTAGDTQTAAAEAERIDVDLLAFVGGDGTATDIMTAVGDRIAVLGVPAGVKMFSECFAQTPEAAADLIAEAYTHGGAQHVRTRTRSAEVLDIDEDAYRAGSVAVRHRGAVRIPASPRIASAKCPACPRDGLEEAVGEILLRMQESPDALYLMGGGSTIAELERALGVEPSLIGFDVISKRLAGASPPGAEPESDDAEWTCIASDVDAHGLEAHVDGAVRAGRDVIAVVTPIGGQGFVLGRGTQQLTPRVLKHVLPDRLWILATTGKLETIEDQRLRMDTGDPEQDAHVPDYLRVVVGLGREKVVRVAKSTPDGFSA